MSKSELARREERAQDGIIQFAEEMQAIRDGNLYPGAKVVPDAWKTYCKDRWGQSEKTVSEIIQALPVIVRLSADRVSAEMPSVSAAARVASLPVKVQDAILTDAPKRNMAADKAKAARAVQRKAEAEGREATDDELIAAAAAVKLPKPKPKSKPSSRFTRYLAAALHETQNAADYAQGDVLSDTENDFAWTVVGRLEHQIERLKDKLFQPDHVRNVDAEFAELLGGDES